MTLHAQQIARTALRDIHLQRERIARAVRDMAVRADDLPGLEAPAQRERLRPVEAIGAAVRPEFALEIVLGDRLADEERQREIVVVVAGAEAQADVLLVAVAVGARVEGLSRRRRPGRENLQDAIELAILRAGVIGGLACRVFLPRLHQLDVRLARAVTGLTADAHLGPRRLVALGCDVEALRDIGAVTVEAVGVPDLPEIVRAFGDGSDL